MASTRAFINVVIILVPGCPRLVTAFRVTSDVRKIDLIVRVSVPYAVAVDYPIGLPSG